MSSATSASNSLRISPDFDVLAWLIQLWLTTRPEDGILRPRIYDIALGLYGENSGGAYELINDALSRLGYTRLALEIDKKKQNPFHADGSLISYVKPVRTKEGLQPTVISLAAGITHGILEKERVDYPLAILRSFHGRQELAKRIWVYLAAENWTKIPGHDDLEQTYLILHDKAFATFGMNYKDHRYAHRAIANACRVIREKDHRYLAAGTYLDVEKVNGQKRLTARRVTSACWKKNGADIEEQIARMRAEIRGAVGRRDAGVPARKLAA